MTRAAIVKVSFPGRWAWSFGSLLRRSVSTLCVYCGRQFSCGAAELRIEARMATLSIPLPEEDLDFLQTFAHGQGTTAEHWLADHARALRMNLKAPLHPDVAAATGILVPGADPQSDYLQYLERKHQ
jgi:hypothetical protein